MNKKMTWAAVTVVLVGLLVGPARWAMPGAPAAALAKAPARKTTPARAPAPKALSPATVLQLTNSLRAGDTATRQTRLKLIEMIAIQYLSDVKATRRISIQQWHHLVTELRVDLTPKARSAWAAQLRLAFSANNNAIKAMGLQKIAYLVAVGHMLGDKQASQLVFSWLKLQGPQSIVASTGSVRAAATLLMRADGDATRQLIKEFHKILSARHSETPLTYQQYNQFCKTCLDVGCNTEARQWGMRAYQATVGTQQLRASADVASLARLGNVLIETGMVGQGKEYTEFAIVLAGHAGRGRLAKSVAKAKSLGAPLGTDRARKMVQAGLLNSKGTLQTGVTEVVAWAYKTSGQLKVWDEYLEWKARDEKIPADTRAMWLVARAYSASISRDSIEPRLGKRWLAAALATAESQPKRFSLAQRLVNYYRGKRRPELAISLLDSIQNQFSGDARDKLDALRHTLEAEHAARQEKVAAKKASLLAAHRKSLLSYYQKKLGLARQTKETRKIAELEAAIEKLKKEQR